LFYKRLIETDSSILMFYKRLTETGRKNWLWRYGLVTNCLLPTVVHHTLHKFNNIIN